MTNAPDLSLLIEHAEALQRDTEKVYRETRYEDLNHAILAMSIVRHALHEVKEHTGLGGTILKAPDPMRFQAAQNLLRQAEALRTQAEQMLAQAHQEDLKTATQALRLAIGSLHEVAEHYE